MANFVIWGRVQQVGLREFVAIASAVPAEPNVNGVEAMPRLTETREDAEKWLRSAVIALGERVRSNGHIIVDVETDGV